MINFVTMGDTNYFETVLLNVINIRKLYKDSAIFVVDLGFKRSERETFQALGVEVGSVPVKRGERFGIIANSIKPLVLLAACEKQNPKDTLVWIDGDAVILRKIDEVLGFDCVVTVREHKRPNSKINAGVMVLNKNKRLFLLSWAMRVTEELVLNRSMWSEQDALNKFVYSDVFPYHEVPCSIYNYTKIEDGIPDDVKIVHLKKDRRLNKELMKKVYEASPK